MISVLINNHNYGDFIGEAIESVLQQTYRNFEIIIVDGASSDCSREVIMKYVNEYPDLITAVFKPTSGQGAAFNVGYKLAKGDILAFLDSDDYFYPNKLQKIVEWHKDYSFIGHNRKFIDKHGNLKTTSTLIDQFEDRPLLLKKYGYIYTYNLTTSTISMTKALADMIFPMPENYITFADCYVKVLAQYYDNIKFYPDALSFYRIHEMQKTQSFTDTHTINVFCQNLYDEVFSDINLKLNAKGEKIIPQLTEENLMQALQMANANLKIDQSKQYAFYGSGVYAEKVYTVMTKVGCRIKYIIDSDEGKVGKTWNGVPIISLKDALNKRREYKQIIITSNNYWKEIQDTLLAHELKSGDDFGVFVSLPND